MSVIVKSLNSPHSATAFVKGAPEALRELCSSESLPSDYDELLNFYTRHGYRVIACAAKHYPQLSWIKAQRLKREEVESNLTFLGFVVFENRLKKETQPSIAELKRADIRVVMCTGDNIRTAVSVGIQAGMLESNEFVFCSYLQSEELGVVWREVEHEEMIADPVTLKPMLKSSFSLAVTGDAFRWLVDNSSEDVLNRILVKATIFARMSPDEKQELVELLQKIGYCVGFCGDGANDCGALKSADVNLVISAKLNC